MISRAPVIEINRYLKVRRSVRAIVVAGFFGCIAIAVYGWLHEGEPFVNTDAFFATLVTPGIVALLAAEFLRRSKCPRCGNRFAAAAGDKRWNNFISHCANCGLRLDGANTSEF